MSNTERPARPEGWCVCGDANCVDALMSANKADAYMDDLEAENRKSRKLYAELETVATDNAGRLRALEIERTELKAEVAEQKRQRVYLRPMI